LKKETKRNQASWWGNPASETAKRQRDFFLVLLFFPWVEVASAKLQLCKNSTRPAIGSGCSHETGGTSKASKVEACGGWKCRPEPQTHTQECGMLIQTFPVNPQITICNFIELLVYAHVHTNVLCIYLYLYIYIHIYIYILCIYIMYIYI
jgi:hypothetical protein